MSDASLVITNTPEPGVTGEARGYISQHDARGVWLNDRDDWRGQSMFIPTHMIVRVYENCGWSFKP